MIFETFYLIEKGNYTNLLYLLKFKTNVYHLKDLQESE